MLHEQRTAVCGRRRRVVARRLDRPGVARDGAIPVGGMPLPTFHAKLAYESSSKNSFT